jgi:tRNA 2-selenouridine synthase
MNDLPKISPAEFLRLSREWPVIDVRSPAEYKQGHIPGAVSIALFDDEERAIVGTAYTRQGHHHSVKAGLALVGKKLAGFIEQAEKHGAGKHALVHCWRGGMRSEAMAWLFRFTGIDALVLEGGYKAYRRHIREMLGSGPPLKVLGGMTGSGKTEVLRSLAGLGARVIDLEGLACHKGSAFGALGQSEQPTSEQFENELAGQWIDFDGDDPVWVEDESLNIGKIVIPEPLFLKIQQSPLYLLETAYESRVERLAEEYGAYDFSILEELILRIGRRMGGDQARNAISALNMGDVRNAIRIVLSYYDKAYRYTLENRLRSPERVIDSREFDGVAGIAAYIRTIR